MGKYIDAEKLIKKVRFARDNFYKQVDIEPKDEASLFCGMYCDALLQQIQSLQQKQPEVDLENEISNYMKIHHLHIKDGGRVVFDNDDSPNFMCDIRDIARHFYELGLNARKEE